MDSGASNYYFGMELCDMSLQEYLVENDGLFGKNVYQLQKIQVLVAYFLSEYEARIVLGYSLRT